MSFSSDVKKEIGTLNNLKHKEQIKYELIGYLLSNNSEVLKNKKIRYATENDYNINRLSKILSNLEIEYNIEMNGNLFVITIKNDVNLIEINRLERNIEVKDKNKILNTKEENRKAIIRGMFLGAGSINNPQKKYHFEISFSSEENLDFATELLKLFDIKSKKLVTKDKFCIYIKEGEEISKILALLGASNAVMKFEDFRIEHEMRGKINRLVNCETANLTKTINAAIEQIEAIEKLRKSGELSKLDEGLREIAELRVNNPNISLTELGKLANPPIGKSAVNYRLKKIISLSK